MVGGMCGKGACMGHVCWACVMGVCDGGVHGTGEACVAGGMHGWGHVWQGHAWQEGMHGRVGACVAGGVHGGGVRAWWGCACMAGVCMAGGMCGMGHAW